ncbi:MAG: hypothetical protein M1819_006071 [Sarea resinae]|nr:MAG: hypothetical protein M1819_006071 [Sarea resinae]
MPPYDSDGGRKRRRSQSASGSDVEARVPARRGLHEDDSHRRYRREELEESYRDARSSRRHEDRYRSRSYDEYEEPRSKRPYIEEDERPRSKRIHDEDEPKHRRRRSPSHSAHHHPKRHLSRSPGRAEKEGEEGEERLRRHHHHHHHSKRRHSRSRSPTRRHSSRPKSKSPPVPRSRAPLPSQADAFNPKDPSSTSDEPPAPEKQKPNFAPTGLLARETNTVTVAGTSVVLKYNEPPEARKPPARDAWRLYVFKGEDMLETLELGTRSCWLVGRERSVADLPVEHPSCSGQHAVFQFRFVSRVNGFGDREGKVRPYIIDLESSNGTLVNGEKIPPSRYFELKDKDMVQFGLSTREYVLMLPPPPAATS